MKYNSKKGGHQSTFSVIWASKLTNMDNFMLSLSFKLHHSVLLKDKFIEIDFF